MGYQFNVFTGTLDLTGSGGGGAASWKTPVATEAGLSTSGNTDGDSVVTLDTDYIWVWDGSTSRWINTGLKLASVGSTPSAAGYSLDYVNVASNRREYRLTLQPADATHPGVVSTSAQTLAGSKTFPSQIQADGGIDTTGATTLAIGTTNASIINLGNASATINFNGTVNNNNVTNLNVADQLITINDGGGAGSGSGAGFEIEEAAVATGYFKTSGDRNSFLLKAPNTAGEATITPGSGGILLTQSIATSSSPTFVGQTLSSLSTAGVVHNNSSGVLSTSLIVNADINASAAIAYSKLNLLDSIKNSDISSVAAIDASKIANGSVSSVEFQYLDGVTSAIQTQLDAKLTSTLANGAIFIGNGSNLATAQTPSGDVTISNTGVTAITSDVIVNADINSAAAIAYSKLNLALSIVNADIGTAAAIAYSKLNLVGSIVNADINASAAIAYTKLNLTGSIVNADINASAAIDASKIANGSVSSVEFQYLDGVTSSIQTQIDSKVTTQTGDIVLTSFTAADNQAVAANITGFSFANGTVRAFDALVSVIRGGATFQVMKFNGIQKGSSWEMSQDTTGDDCGLVFTITTAGQIQYTSSSTGNTALVKFRAQVTTV